MTYLDAVKEMVNHHGWDAIYSDGACDWDGYNLVDGAMDVDDDESCYEYTSGAIGTRPGVYVIGDDDLIPSVPMVEPRE